MADSSKLAKNFETKKGKAGKYCPFFETYESEGKKKNKPCGTYCALFCVGLNSCVFHAINLNLSKLLPKKEKQKN